MTYKCPNEHCSKHYPNNPKPYQPLDLFRLEDIRQQGREELERASREYILRSIKQSIASTNKDSNGQDSH